MLAIPLVAEDRHIECYERWILASTYLLKVCYAGYGEVDVGRLLFRK